MKRKLQAVVSKKRLKFSHVPTNQSLITNHFVLATPNSLLNVGHIPDFEANDEDNIVIHRANKRVIVEDEEEVLDEVLSMDEDVIEEEVLDEVTSMAEDVIVCQPKKYKYADSTFYNLLASFYQNSANKLVTVPSAIVKQANELVCLELPNVTKKQAYNIVAKCAMECRGNIKVYNGKKARNSASVKKI